VPERRTRVTRTKRRTRTTRATRNARRPRADYQGAAKARLKRFRQGSVLAVAMTSLLLMMWGATAAPADASSGVTQDTTAVTQDTAATAGVTPAEAQQAGLADSSASAQASRSVEEATGTLRALFVEFTAILPKILIALALLFIAWLFVRLLLRPLMRRAFGNWQKSQAATTLITILIWLGAVSIAISVLAGDVRALLGSVGLVGLALSWALQAPIESFTAWLLNSFKGYYRVGDRIEVGDVFGDVYRIDLLTTTVWEAGGPDKPVQGAQPTGALITFPNSEVLRSNIVNYTRDFAYVWDEVTIGVANESDLGYSMRVARETANRVIGGAMAGPVATYRSMLDASRLPSDIADEPQAYLSQTDAWTNITIRYLVAARERRRWATALILALAEETGKSEHRGKIVASYPSSRVALARDNDWRPGGNAKDRSSGGG
jgi:hypothetical protein